MKVLLIGNTKCHAAKRIAEECGKRGIEYKGVRPDELIFSVSGKKTALAHVDGTSLLENDVYIFRGIGIRIEELVVIARYLKSIEKTIVEDIFAREGVYIDKFSPTISTGADFTPDYHLVFSKQQELFNSLEYPLIVKDLHSSKGKKVRLAKSIEELNTYLEDTTLFSYPVLLQQYLPVNHDYRVMVVNGEVLGAMKRYANEGDFLTIRAGGKREAVAVREKAARVALHAAEKAQLDVAGIDLIEKNGDFFRIEVNMSPQFRVFEHVTNVNVAEKIVDCLMQRYTENIDKHT